MTFCINRHPNPDNADQCIVCHLPIIDCQGEINRLRQLLSKKAVFARPKVATIYYATGGRGSAIVHELQTLISSFGKTSFCYFDSSTEDLAKITEGDSSVRTHKVGSMSAGGMVYCGLGEAAAASDGGLVDELYLSGCREQDQSQILFFVSSLGGGTASGVGPYILTTCKRINPNATAIVITVLPSGDEPMQAHFNAYYGVSNLLAAEGKPLADLLVVLDYDRLRQTRAVGKGGRELRLEYIATYLLKLMGVTFSESTVMPLIRTVRGLGIQVVIPCLAFGRSMNIFGNLTNVLESALILPLAPLEASRVTFSCLLLSIPRRLAKSFPSNSVSEEFQGWNKKHFPGLRASMFHIAQGEELSDRVDCCVLLGGNSLDTTMHKTRLGYESFKTFLEVSGQWANCGVNPRRLKAAEEAMSRYDLALHPAG